MRSTPLISVILPTYHIEKEYFNQCIDSIKRQSYENWEALVIDDGNSSEYAIWLDTFADQKVRIIHQKNGGVSAARNRGVQEAKGEWIYFCDPDDWMHKDELSVLLKAVLTSQAEVAVCQYIGVDGKIESRTEDNCILNEFHTVDKKDVNEVLLELIAPGRAKALHSNEWMSTCANRFPWAHLYKASLVKDTQFVSLSIGEDRIFNLYMCENAKCIVFVLSKLHYYRVGNGVSGQFSQALIDNGLLFIDALSKFIENHLWYGDITREINKTMMDGISAQTKCILSISKNYLDFKQRIGDLLKSELYRCAIKDIDNPFYTKNERILCFLYRFKLLRFLRFYWRIFQ